MKRIKIKLITGRDSIKRISARIVMTLVCSLVVFAIGMFSLLTDFFLKAAK